MWRRHWPFLSSCGASLARLLLVVQSVLLAALLIFSVVTRPSEDPFGVTAGVAVMIAVFAMACQYASLGFAGSSLDGRHDWQLDQYSLVAVGSAVEGRALPGADTTRLKRSLYLL